MPSSAFTVNTEKRRHKIKMYVFFMFIYLLLIVLVVFGKSNERNLKSLLVSINNKF